MWHSISWQSGFVDASVTSPPPDDPMVDPSPYDLVGTWNDFDEYGGMGDEVTLLYDGAYFIHSVGIDNVVRLSGRWRHVEGRVELLDEGCFTDEPLSWGHGGTECMCQRIVPTTVEETLFLIPEGYAEMEGMWLRKDARER